jgi:hypothetical protein
LVGETGATASLLAVAVSSYIAGCALKFPGSTLTIGSTEPGHKAVCIRTTRSFGEKYVSRTGIAALIVISSSTDKNCLSAYRYTGAEVITGSTVRSCELALLCPGIPAPRKYISSTSINTIIVISRSTNKGDIATQRYMTIEGTDSFKLLRP